MEGRRPGADAEQAALPVGGREVARGDGDIRFRGRPVDERSSTDASEEDLEASSHGPGLISARAHEEATKRLCSNIRADPSLPSVRQFLPERIDAQQKSVAEGPEYESWTVLAMDSWERIRLP